MVKRKECHRFRIGSSRTRRVNTSMSVVDTSNRRIFLISDDVCSTPVFVSPATVSFREPVCRPRALVTYDRHSSCLPYNRSAHRTRIDQSETTRFLSSRRSTYSPDLCPLPLSTWTQRVHRLNTEYRLTVDALEQIKEYFQPMETARADIDRSCPHEFKSSVSTIVPSLEDSTVDQHWPLSIGRTERRAVRPSLHFEKPTIARRIDLNRFPILSIVEHSEPKTSLIQQATHSRTVDNESRHGTVNVDTVHMPINERTTNEWSDTLWSLPVDQYASLPSSPLNQTPVDTNQSDEETTYTIETFYRTADDSPLVILTETTTREQFDIVCTSSDRHVFTARSSSLCTKGTHRPISPDHIDSFDQRTEFTYE
jgi:hypothetical protein